MTPRSSVPNVSDPLKPRCRSVFRPRVFFMRPRRAIAKPSMYPKSLHSLALNDLHGCRPLPKTRDIASLSPGSASTSINAICLGKTQRQSAWVKTLVASCHSKPTPPIGFCIGRSCCNSLQTHTGSSKLLGEQCFPNLHRGHHEGH